MRRVRGSMWHLSETSKCENCWPSPLFHLLTTHYLQGYHHQQHGVGTHFHDSACPIAARMVKLPSISQSALSIQYIRSTLVVCDSVLGRFPGMLSPRMAEPPKFTTVVSRGFLPCLILRLWGIAFLPLHRHSSLFSSLFSLVSLIGSCTERSFTPSEKADGPM